MTLKLMTLQVVQRARPLITLICIVGAQSFKAVNTPGRGGGGGGRGRGDELPYKKDGGALFLGVKKQFWFLLGCFSLKRSTARAFAVVFTR